MESFKKDHPEKHHHKKPWGISLRSLNFLDGLRRDHRQFAVIGLGRFGRAVCETLHKLGYDVMGTDIDEKLVAQVITDRIASTAIQLDSTKPIALREAGLFEFDTVIVAIGNYIEESIITTLNLKEAGVHCVVAKASTEIHGKLLKRVGADIVIFPEYEAGCDLAYTLTKPAILERLDLDQENSIVEVRVPEEFDNKSLAELQIRARFGLNVIAIGDGERYKINPNPQDRIHKGCAMVIMGSNKDIQRLPI
uniref:TrkA-N domain protein n=1 Tax=Gloeothece verrucosa (strain PCC 7822) TaxID=497965 RepID=E0UE59_GLOV7|nr:TrkA-N domain protein [Gloeothece verrucosa PCC 7822]